VGRGLGGPWQQRRYGAADQSAKPGVVAGLGVKSSAVRLLGRAGGPWRCSAPVFLAGLARTRALIVYFDSNRPVEALKGTSLAGCWANLGAA